MVAKIQLNVSQFYEKSIELNPIWTLGHANITGNDIEDVLESLGIFHANQISKSEITVCWYHKTCLSPPVKVCCTDRSKVVLLFWIIFVINVLCLS